jgi:hypothetical protein
VNVGPCPQLVWLLHGRCIGTGSDWHPRNMRRTWDHHAHGASASMSQHHPTIAWRVQAAYVGQPLGLLVAASAPLAQRAAALVDVTYEPAGEPVVTIEQVRSWVGSSTASERFGLAGRGQGPDGMPCVAHPVSEPAGGSGHPNLLLLLRGGSCAADVRCVLLPCCRLWLLAASTTMMPLPAWPSCACGPRGMWRRPCQALPTK